MRTPKGPPLTSSIPSPATYHFTDAERRTIAAYDQVNGFDLTTEVDISGGDSDTAHVGSKQLGSWSLQRFAGGLILEVQTVPASCTEIVRSWEPVGSVAEALEIINAHAAELSPLIATINNLCLGRAQRAVAAGGGMAVEERETMEEAAKRLGLNRDDS
jgi:hypothetical protein